MTDAESAGISKTKSQKRKMITAATIAISIIVVVVVIYFGILPNSPLKNTGVSGIYDAVSPSLAGQYIELKSDGTAYFRFSSYGVSGTWELRDGNRIFVTTSQGAAGYLRIDGNNLIDESGWVYTKRR